MAAFAPPTPLTAPPTPASPLDAAEVAQAVEGLKTSKLYPGSPGYQAALDGLRDLQTSNDGATAAAPPATPPRARGDSAGAAEDGGREQQTEASPAPMPPSSPLPEPASPAPASAPVAPRARAPAASKQAPPAKAKPRKKRAPAPPSKPEETLVAAPKRARGGTRGRKKGDAALQRPQKRKPGPKPAAAAKRPRATPVAPDAGAAPPPKPRAPKPSTKRRREPLRDHLKASSTGKDAPSAVLPAGSKRQKKERKVSCPGGCGQMILQEELDAHCLAFHPWMFR